MAEIKVNPHIITLGFFDLLFKCKNNAIKNNVITVEPRNPRPEASIDNIFPTNDTNITIKDIITNDFSIFSLNKSSGSINSLGCFLRITSFSMSTISWSICLISLP